MPFVTLLRSTALMLFLFTVVYFPVMAIAAGLHLSTDMMVVAVMIGSLAVAGTLMSIAVRYSWLSAIDFGLRWPTQPYLIYALVLAIPLSALTAWAISHVHEPGPLGGLHMVPWQMYLCFAVGAPIQEEVIFRGLLQSALARSLALAPRYAAVSGLAASLSVAALFGIIHWVVGPWTALGALVLGVLAGELRRRSGRLLPSIVCHAIFNLGGMLWVLH
ncbi:MAG: type II CAAX endopeptidase family protein [Rhodanobacter sp.]